LKLGTCGLPYSYSYILRIGIGTDKRNAGLWIPQYNNIIISLLLIHYSIWAKGNKIKVCSLVGYASDKGTVQQVVAVRLV
jgi:hypothetical protein